MAHLRQPPSEGTSLKRKYMNLSKKEIPLSELRKGMKVYATSPLKNVKGIISDIGHTTFGVYDGEQNWGFFLNEPGKAKVYLLDEQTEFCECKRCEKCGKLLS